LLRITYDMAISMCCFVVLTYFWLYGDAFQAMHSEFATFVARPVIQAPNHIVWQMEHPYDVVTKACIEIPWSAGTAKSRSEDISSIRRDIAVEVSNCLRLPATDTEKKGLTKRSTESCEGYHLYLKTIYFASK